MSQTTKRALAASLKKLLSQRPLDKITVVDVTEDCEVNRQTFYYHFKDIYDLLEWTYINETVRALEGNRTYDTWQEGFLRIFEYVQENGSMVVNTLRSGRREYLERFLLKETFALLLGVVEEKAAGLDVREEDKTFIADFYKFAFVGLLMDWINRGMREEPRRIVARLDALIHGDISRALDRLRTNPPN